MSDLIDNINRIHKEQCPYIDNSICEGTIRMIDGSYAKGIICLDLKHKKCEIFLQLEDMIKSTGGGYY